MIAGLVQILRRHRAAVAANVVLLAAASVVVIITRPFSTSVLDLLPLQDRVISKHYRFLKLSGAMEQVVFEVAKGDSTMPFADLGTAAVSVKEALTKSGLVAFPADLGPGDFLRLRNLIVTNWPNLFTAEDSSWVVQRLNRDSLSAEFDTRIKALFGFTDAATDAFLLQNDPFGLAQYGLRAMAAFRPTEEMTIVDGFITNRTQDKILFVGSMAQPGMDDAAGKALVHVMDSVGSVAGGMGAQVTWMGAVRASRDNAVTVQKDVNLTAPIAIVLIFLICLLIYRRFYFGLLAFVPTILGILFTLAAFLLVGRVSIIILGFGAALLGITIDYAIHYLFHIDSNPTDATPEQTLAPPIIASALTTAGAFAVLMIAGIPGLSLLGMVTAVGIIAVATLSIVVLPVFFTPSDTDHTPKFHVDPEKWFSIFYDNGMDVWVAIPVVAVAVAGWLLVGRLQFDGDPSRMNGMSHETVAAEKRIEEHWPGLTDGAFLVASDSSLDGVLAKAEANMVPLVAQLSRTGAIGPARVLTAILPSLESQAKNRERWSNVFTKVRAGMMLEAADSICLKYGLESEQFQDYARRTTETDSITPLVLAHFPEPVRKGLIGNYLFHKHKTWYLSLPVFMQGSDWTSISNEARKHGVLAVNDAVLGERVVEIIRQGFVRCVAYIPLVVALVLLVMLRSIRFAFAAFAPCALAAGITLGTMALLGIPVTIISLMIFAFVFGLGIDYCLLLVHMIRLSRYDSNARLSHAAASVSVAALTTLAGLGVMAVAGHPVLMMIGRVGLIGILSSYVCAITLVPGLMKVLGHRGSR